MNSHNENADKSSDSVGEPLLRKLIDFCQALRDEDVVVTPSETLDATSALIFTDLTDRELFYSGLKSTLVKRSEYYPKFDILFEKFWLGKERDSSIVKPSGRFSLPSETKNAAKNVKDATTNQRISRFTASNQLLEIISNRDLSKETQDQVYGIYSPIETISRKSFGDLTAQDRSLLKRGLRAFARRMASLSGRRFAISNVGKIDFRRTLRTSLESGGQMTDIRLSRQKISKSRLVMFCDVSGSMDLYSNQLLKLLYYACNTIHRTEVFAFSTQLVSLNKYIQGRSFWEAVHLVSRNVNIWNSGTRIGSALGLLLSEHPGVLRSSTVFIVISDGWELGDLDLLKKRLREIKGRVVKIVWLNPQADSPNYSPLAAGMKAALPFIDVFSGINIFTNKREFERILGRTIY